MEISPTTADTTEQDDARWHALVNRVRARRTELREKFMVGFPVDERYGPGSVPADDVIEVIDDTMEMFLRRLSGEALEERHRAIPELLGKRRAQQRIEEHLLLTGVRSTFNVLWRAFREEAGEEDQDLLIERVESMLRLVEQHVSSVQRAYIVESSHMARDDQRARDNALTRFIAGADASQEELAAVSATLGIDPAAPIWVALIDAHQIGSEESLRAWPHRAPWQDLVVLLSTAQASPDLPGQRTRAVVLRHPTGLAQVPKLVREMAGLASALPADRIPAYLDELLLKNAGSELLARLGRADVILGDELFAIRSTERARLLETLRAYNERGSIGGAAEVLFCHRNTVVTRLRRVHELTGYDPTIPREAALLALLLELF